MFLKRVAYTSRQLHMDRAPLGERLVQRCTVKRSCTAVLGMLLKWAHVPSLIGNVSINMM